MKGQVKFQVAPIELKLGESNAGWEAITKRVWRRTPSDVIWGQIAPIELKLWEVNPECRLSRPYTKAGNLAYIEYTRAGNLAQVSCSVA